LTTLTTTTDAERKALATIQAEAARLGVEVLLLPDGRLIASRDGSWFRVLRNGRDLAHFLGRGWLI
jgi:hemin uptake protein HemP